MPAEISPCANKPDPHASTKDRPPPKLSPASKLPMPATRARPDPPPTVMNQETPPPGWGCKQRRCSEAGRGGEHPRASRPQPPAAAPRCPRARYRRPLTTLPRRRLRARRHQPQRRTHCGQIWPWAHQKVPNLQPKAGAAESHNGTERAPPPPPSRTLDFQLRARAAARA